MATRKQFRRTYSPRWAPKSAQQSYTIVGGSCAHPFALPFATSVSGVNILMDPFGDPKEFQKNEFAALSAQKTGAQLQHLWAAVPILFATSGSDVHRLLHPFGDPKASQENNFAALGAQKRSAQLHHLWGWRQHTFGPV